MKSTETNVLAQSAAMTQYLALQEQLAAPRARAAQLEQMIAAKRDGIARVKTGPAELAGLVSKREDLLADRAMGHNIDADLADLDAEIARREQEAADVGGFIASEEQAIAGLERRLQAANQEIAALTSGNEEGERIAAVMQAHAVALADEYNRAGKQMERAFIRLNAVDQLFRKRNVVSGLGYRGLGYRGRLFDVHKFEIPACMMDADGPHDERTGYRDRLFIASSIQTPEWNAAVEAERTELLAAGLDRV